MKQRSRPASVAYSNALDYRETFVARAHQLMKLGYNRMTPVRFANEDEEVITEYFRIAIRQVFDDPVEGILDWVDYFSISENEQINSSGRHGKGRLKIDIRIESGQVHPRCHILFEAKRLGKGHPANTYLGPEGMGAYLTGEYAADDRDAGMIGYVQQQDEVHWSNEIGNELTANPADHACSQPVTWKNETLVAGFNFNFSSNHDRQRPMTAIRVFHTFLLFH